MNVVHEQFKSKSPGDIPEKMRLLTVSLATVVEIATQRPCPFQLSQGCSSTLALVPRSPPGIQERDCTRPRQPPRTFPIPASERWNRQLAQLHVSPPAKGLHGVQPTCTNRTFIFHSPSFMRQPLSQRVVSSFEVACVLAFHVFDHSVREQDVQGTDKRYVPLDEAASCFLPLLNSG